MQNKNVEEILAIWNKLLVVCLECKRNSSSLRENLVSVDGKFLSKEKHAIKWSWIKYKLKSHLRTFNSCRCRKDKISNKIRYLNFNQIIIN